MFPLEIRTSKEFASLQWRENIARGLFHPEANVLNSYWFSGIPENVQWGKTNLWYYAYFSFSAREIVENIAIAKRETGSPSSRQKFFPHRTPSDCGLCLAEWFLLLFWPARRNKNASFIWQKRIFLKKRKPCWSQPEYSYFPILMEFRTLPHLVTSNAKTHRASIWSVRRKFH